MNVVIEVPGTVSREEQLLTIAQVRQILNISRATINRVVLPYMPVVRLGDRVLVRRADLEAFIEQNTIAPD